MPVLVSGGTAKSFVMPNKPSKLVRGYDGNQNKFCEFLANTACHMRHGLQAPELPEVRGAFAAEERCEP